MSDNHQFLFLLSPPTMSTITRVLNNGSKIPWIGFGTGTALYAKAADEPVTLALQSGFTHLDGAQVYKNEVSCLA